MHIISAVPWRPTVRWSGTCTSYFYTYQAVARCAAPARSRRARGARGRAAKCTHSQKVNAPQKILKMFHRETGFLFFPSEVRPGGADGATPEELPLREGFDAACLGSLLRPLVSRLAGLCPPAPRGLRQRRPHLPRHSLGARRQRQLQRRRLGPCARGKHRETRTLGSELARSSCGTSFRTRLLRTCVFSYR